jgi:hypothetical protein
MAGLSLARLHPWSGTLPSPSGLLRLKAIFCPAKD